MKVYLAGIENYLQEAKQLGLRYGLISFYYKNSLKRKPDFDLMLDSGAFTFMNSDRGASNIESYLEKYIQFINRYDIDRFFELDVDNVIGVEKVRKMRKRLEAETGKQSIPVWHFNRGKENYLKLVKNYDYLAYGGFLTDGISRKRNLKYVPWFINKAHENNCKIHGLGFSGPKLLNKRKYKFDSVDSTNWQTLRYNHYDVFSGRGMKRIDKRQGENQRKIKKIKKDSKEDYRHFQLEEWIKFQRYLDKQGSSQNPA